MAGKTPKRAKAKPARKAAAAKAAPSLEERIGHRFTDRALLVHGGVGYTRKYPIERLYRDARLNWVEEGTPTIQRLVIAREFLEGYRWTGDRDLG